MSKKILTFVIFLLINQNLYLLSDDLVDKEVRSCSSYNLCCPDSCKIFTTPTTGCFCFDSNGDLTYPQQNSNFIVNITSTPFEFQIYLFKPFYSGNIATSSSIVNSILTITDITQAGFKISSSIASAGLICFLISENSISISNN